MVIFQCELATVDPLFRGTPARVHVRHEGNGDPHKLATLSLRPFKYVRNNRLLSKLNRTLNPRWSQLGKAGEKERQLYIGRRMTSSTEVVHDSFHLSFIEQ